MTLNSINWWWMNSFYSSLFLAATKQLFEHSFCLSIRPSVCHIFLAATKQVYEWYFLSVCLSVWPSHLFSCDQAALQMVFSVCPSVCLSVRLSVCLSHLFDYVPIIVSSWNFQELLPMTKVRSMQKVKVRGQRSRSQRSQPNLTVSGL